MCNFNFDNVNISKLDVNPGQVLLIQIPADTPDGESAVFFEAMKTFFCRVLPDVEVLMTKDLVNFGVVTKWEYSDNANKTE